MKSVLIVVGTRPNFIKVTQFKQEAAKRSMDVRIVHTGQHYDEKMSNVFKLSQDRDHESYLNIIAKLEEQGIDGQEIAEEMKKRIGELFPDKAVS